MFDPVIISGIRQRLEEVKDAAIGQIPNAGSTPEAYQIGQLLGDIMTALRKIEEIEDGASHG